MNALPTEGSFPEDPLPGHADTSFLVGLYLDHAEEAAFLYEQRRDVLLDAPDLSWTDLADTEERLEAHLDALGLGEALAAAVCRQQRDEGEAGALYVALCVFCRQRRKDWFEETLDGVEADDAEHVLAVRDALAAELPEAWDDGVIGWLCHGEPWRQRAAAYVAGAHRLPVAEELVHALPEVASEAVPEILWALGRVSDDTERRVLWGYVRHESVAVREAAALALLSLGAHVVVKQVAVYVPAPWAMLLLGVSGGAEHRALIHEHLEADGATPEGLLALGLLGDPRSVDLLLLHLRTPDLAEASALALYLLTGAEHDEEVFQPEEVSEDELFEDEVEAFRRGEAPARSDGTPFGTTSTRLSQDADTWEAWWKEQAGRFQNGVRYRFGEPCTPASIVRALESARMPRRMRQLMLEELIIRYRLAVYFEADAAVYTQLRGLGELRRQVAQHDPPFQPGRWYLGGQALSG